MAKRKNNVKKFKSNTMVVEVSHTAGGMGTSPYLASKAMARSASPRDLKKRDRKNAKQSLKRGDW